MSAHDFIFLALAVWRVVNLICNENGPFRSVDELDGPKGVFDALRRWTKRMEETHRWAAAFHLHELNTCEWCLSVWVGAFTTLAYLFFPTIVLWIAYALSLSTVTIVLKYILHTLQNTESLLDVQKKLIIREASKRATKESQNETR